MSLPIPRRSLLWLISLVLLFTAIDGVVQLGLVSTMVAFIHSYSGTPILVLPSDDDNGPPYPISSFPENLVTNPGHVANAAGGTAVVLVGFGGAVALAVQKRSRRKHKKSHPLFYLWSLIVLLSFLLTLGALIYAFAETANLSGQTIDEAIARQNPPPAKYPLGQWTPETWGDAVLLLPLANNVQRHRIHGKVDIMRAWRWNLLALLICGFALLMVVGLELVRLRWGEEEEEEEEVKSEGVPVLTVRE